MRTPALVRGCLLAVAVIAGTLGVPAPAWADSGDYGLVWDALPSLPDQWFTAGGRTSEIVRRATGDYVVTFTGRADSGGNAQAMATSLDGSFCQIAAWYPVGSDERVAVACFDARGVRKDVPFQANFGYRSGTGSRGFTYLWADNPSATSTYTPAPGYAYDSTGGRPSVSRWSTGHYWVYLPASVGLDWVSPESFQVTAYGSAPAHCQLSSSMHADGWQEVTCLDPAGAPVDAYFSLSFAYKQSLLGAAVPNFAYGYIDGTAWNPVTLYAYSWTGASGTSAIAAAGVSTGRYSVKLYGVMTSDEPYPYAYAANGYPTYCSVDGWSTAGTTEILDVICYDAATHAPAQSAFYVAFVGLYH